MHGCRRLRGIGPQIRGRVAATSWEVASCPARAPLGKERRIRMATVAEVTSAAVPGTRVGRVRWTIVLMLFLITIINYADRASMSVAKPAMSKEFGINAAQMGWILSAFGWSYVVCQNP